MRIAIVTPTAGQAGGVETFNAALVDAFQEVGHNVSFFSKERVENNFAIRLVARFIGLKRALGLLVRFADRMRRLDVVLCNGEYGLHVSHRRCVIVFHGSYHGYYSAIERFLDASTRTWARRASCEQVAAAVGKYVVTVSAANAEVLRNQGIAVDQVIANCVDGDRFRPTPGRPVDEELLFVGRHDYHGKGFDILKAVADRGFGIRCVTDQEVAHQGIQCEVSVPHDRMPSYYNRAPLLLFPSRFEASQFAVLEAMSCGCPVVMSRAGIGPEVARRIPDFVVGSENVDDYVSRIVRVRAAREKYGRLARKYVKESHSFKGFKRRWVSLVDRLAQPQT